MRKDRANAIARRAGGFPMHTASAGIREAAATHAPAPAIAWQAHGDGGAIIIDSAGGTTTLTRQQIADGATRAVARLLIQRAAEAIAEGSHNLAWARAAAAATVLGIQEGHIPYAPGGYAPDLAWLEAQSSR